MSKSIVIGANGQIGTELVDALVAKFGANQVVAADIREDANRNDIVYEQLDVLNRDRLFEIITKHNIEHVYLLAALLSATSEQKPLLAWDINMKGLLNVLELAKEGLVKQIFWPSSIAVFGPSSPKDNTPQDCIMDPNTVYGISKLAGERWCQYYFDKYNVDVRSIRYPGLISYKTMPGGGTTDYAVAIFHEAIEKGKYTSYLSENSYLPMMYMDDAIQATLSIMDSSVDNIKVRSSYNIGGISFSPKEIASEIQKYLPDFNIAYESDFRQKIADSWPSSINDNAAKSDWGFNSTVDLEELTKIMLENIQARKEKKV